MYLCSVALKTYLICTGPTTPCHLTIFAMCPTRCARPAI